MRILIVKTDSTVVNFDKIPFEELSQADIAVAITLNGYMLMKDSAEDTEIRLVEL